MTRATHPGNDEQSSVAESADGHRESEAEASADAHPRTRLGAPGALDADSMLQHFIESL